MAFYRPDNMCQFIGRLGKPPKEIRDGRYAFSIAVSNPPDREGKESQPDWPPFYVSGQPADFLNKYCSKGDLLIVTAQYRTWKDKDDNYRHGFDVTQLSKLGGGSSDRDSSSGSPKKTVAAKPNKADDNDTDIPF